MLFPPSELFICQLYKVFTASSQLSTPQSPRSPYTYTYTYTAYIMFGTAGNLEWISFDELARRKGPDVALELAESNYYPMQKVEGLSVDTKVKH